MSTRERKKHGKRYLLFILVLLILVSLFFINFFKGNSSAGYSSGAIKANLSTIATFDYSKVTTVEDQIRKLEMSGGKSSFDISKILTNDQYRKLFNSSVVIGDSITEGLSAYGYLGEEQVFCKIGASIISGDELFESAAQTYPRFAFMSFGMNDMGNYSGDSGKFIEKYTALIKSFHEISPDTRILINAINEPSASTLESRPILQNYKKFNRALEKMCDDLDLTYIDNIYIIEEHPEFYAGDGIHVTSEYYPHWMNSMILKAGL